LGAARKGEAGALDQLFSQFYPGVEQLVHRSLATDLRRNRPWLISRFSTGDVVQEVFRSVLRDLDSFGGKTEDAFRGYLAMIVRNRLIDAIRYHEAARRDGRRAVNKEGIVESIEAEGSQTQRISNAETAEAFHAELAKLPERERLLVRARLENEETFQVLADRLGYDSAGIARRLFYALQAQILMKLRRGESE
ncbi:MAG: sigma-70 family RNA polymerase sigma factor, partial [Planctomycetota bacterium]